MTEHAAVLRERGLKVRLIEAQELDSTGDIAPLLQSAGVAAVRTLDPNDDWLQQRLAAACHAAGIDLSFVPDSAFLTDEGMAEKWLANRKRFFFNDFYIEQRKHLGLLLTSFGSPVGGRWTFDAENRRRLPEATLVPRIPKPEPRASVAEAEQYVARHFPDALGDHDAEFTYPVCRRSALAALREFIEERLHDFGAYEDAISTSEATLFHSVLTPTLNIGIISPHDVLGCLEKRLDDFPLNSVEGFLRQIIGWREFMRLMYRHIGRRQRTSNALNHQRPLPGALYTASTKMPPVDLVISRLMKTGYCHHIERLMVLGSFMNLIEVHPDEIYRWFMEFFIDSYDWVMVPNIYGMSQYADGGLMTTKPYVSGSHYLLKMSDHPKGEWCEVWDGLYWRFVDKNRELLSHNARLGFAVKTLDKMGSRRSRLLKIADDYLGELFAGARTAAEIDDPYPL